jgi:integrase
VTLTATVRDQAKALANLTDDVGPAPPTLATVYWLYGPTRWGSTSWVWEVNRLKPLIRLIGDMPAAKLTPLAWEGYRAQRMTEPDRRGKPPADALLNLELARAKQLLNWAVRHRMVKFNPLASARKVKTADRRETWLPVADVERLLAACDDVVDRRRVDGDDDGLRAKALRAFVLACHDSMLRFGEAAAVIRRRDRIAADGRFELAGRETKGGKGRTVFLTPRTIEAVASLPPVKLGRQQLYRWFREACRLSGVDSLVAPGEVRIRPHDLRASGATTADENGASATAVRDALGHADLSTTQIYLRTEKAENARSATEVMIGATERRPAHRATRKKVHSSTRSLSK